MLIIRDEFFTEGMAEIVSLAVNASRYEATGRIITLWRRSQARREVCLSEAQVGLYLGLPANRVNIWVSALESAGLLKRQADTSWEIVGNRKQIALSDARKNAGKKGGKSTKRPKPGLSPAQAELKPELSPAQANTIQFNSNSNSNSNFSTSPPETEGRDSRAAPPVGGPKIEGRKSGARQRKEAEARAIGSLIFVPTDRGDKKARFVDVRALGLAMVDAIETHGMDTIREFRRQAEAAGVLGKLIFDPNRLTLLLDRAKSGEGLFLEQKKRGGTASG